MAEYQKPAIEVVLFKNNKGGDRSPVQTGVIKFNEPVTFNPGDELEVALWNRMSKSGNQFLSGLAKDKGDYQPRQRTSGGGGGSGGPRRSNAVEIDF